MSHPVMNNRFFESFKYRGHTFTVEYMDIANAMVVRKGIANEYNLTDVITLGNVDSDETPILTAVRLLVDLGY